MARLLLEVCVGLSLGRALDSIYAATPRRSPTQVARRGR
jgi:hypothetical protein